MSADVAENTKSRESNVMDGELYDQHSEAQASLHQMASPMLQQAALEASAAAVQNKDRCFSILAV